MPKPDTPYPEEELAEVVRRHAEAIDRAARVGQAELRAAAIHQAVANCYADGFHRAASSAVQMIREKVR
jgi:hypothetical protein